ncbi:hypothetical protein KORDIASMS9_01461 [Kordia sp. SMS9]|uniref:hypothetical protein n=1 Tax=Kordia sp. SMS9 TaxID=2282170 RepID=UPI000E0D4F0D|nr:hypothetical protein [Kordia sp. SMS9]AXG69241.1 hypothetical protein KORDIASMS9_01461 [Kordia sp. SMS9]
MKKILKFSLILALAVFTFSCSNDNTDVIPEDPQGSETNALIKANLNTYAQNAVSTNQAQSMFENNEENSEIVDDFPIESCFTINFPYTVTNGNTTGTVNNEAEAENFFNAGYTIAFPLDITLTDGTVITLANEFEFIEIIEDCLDEEIISFGNDCFEFNFPLSVITEDGNSVVVNDEFELFSLETAVGFDYPISVTTETENGAVVVTINNDDEFDDLYNECYDIDDCDDCYENCFEIVYPITLVQDNGTIVTVNDDDEFFTFLSGLGENDFFTPTYPMNIEYEDGTLATINSDDELEAAFDACDD